MLTSESKMYLCLLLEFSYSLPSCCVRDVLVQGLMTVTYSVVLRDLFSQCAVESLLEMRVDTAVAVAFAIFVTCFILDLVIPLRFWEMMELIPDEKCSIVVSEYSMDLSSVNFVSFWSSLLMEAACAIAAKFSPAEVPMMVPKVIGPDSAGCVFDLLLLDFVSQAVPRYDRI